MNETTETTIAPLGRLAFVAAAERPDGLRRYRLVRFEDDVLAQMRHTCLRRDRRDRRDRLDEQTRASGTRRR